MDDWGRALSFMVGVVFGFTLVWVAYNFGKGVP